MTRRSARAPIGERACGEAPVRWKRLTVLGALGLDGVVTMTTVTTGTTSPSLSIASRQACCPCCASKTRCHPGHGQPLGPQEPGGQGRHHGGGADAALPAPLFPRLLSHRALLVKDQDCPASRRGENR